MYRTYDGYDGEPPMLYRSAASIKHDIREISLKIKDAEEMLSVRSLLMDMLTECADDDPESWLPEIEEVVAEARESLLHLRQLKDDLDELFDEWREMKCAAGM